MGYYTRFNLQWDAAELSRNEVALFLAPRMYCENESRYDILRGSHSLLDLTREEMETVQDLQKRLMYIDEWLSNCDTTKWYSYESDMLALSAKYPTVTFFLTGDGEEKGDHWRACYYGGKGERVEAVLTFPEFPTMHARCVQFI